ncbi:MAG: 4-alpha-glucanotransferase [Sulfitobacter sp.]
MTVDHALAALADLCGILPRYHDLQGGEHIASPATQKALLAANGLDVSDEGAIYASLAAVRHAIEDRWFPEEVIVESGIETPQSFGLGAVWHLRPDGDAAIIAEGGPGDHITLPSLPSGIYELTATTPDRTEVVTVLVAPRRLPLIEALTGLDRMWGLNFALYGLSSSRNAGLGDFADLGDIAAIAGAQGAAFLGINPLHNMGYSDLDAISPYSPSHRGFLNTAYIALDAIPGLDHSVDMVELTALRQAATVQYGDHKRTHNAALEALFAVFQKTAPPEKKSDFDAFRNKGAAQLTRFAQFEVLCETYGTDWRKWPAKTKAPSKARLEFHMWLQWVANVQLGAAQNAARSAGMPFGLYLDLAVGPRRDGAESWCEQSSIAKGVSIGAPPDQLSPEGQNWDLAAFAPRKLKAQRYAPLRRILAQTMRFAGIIRIDHVLGLNRSFWIPDDGSPGGYIQQNFEALLAVIKIEAERHNCVVIGEDLGLVPNGFRDTMRDNGFYGYSVLQYEKDDHGALSNPGQGPGQVLSCFATHDTPTVRGYEVGRDIEWWHKLSWIDAQTAADLQHRRAEDVAAFMPRADFQTSVHSILAQSNAGLVAVQLDDVLGATEAQNLPGTIDQHPNWRRKYDVAIEDLPNDARLDLIATMMRDAGRAILKEGHSNED